MLGGAIVTGAASQTVAPPTIVEHSCGFVLSAAGIEPEVVEVSTLKVLDPPKDQLELKLEADDGVRFSGVVCWRTPAKFGLRDDRVTAAGLPLYVKSGNEKAPEARTLVLEYAGVGHRIRLVSGPDLSAEEQDELRAIVATFNTRRHSRPSPDE